jgi:hypothetical protein
LCGPRNDLERLNGVAAEREKVIVEGVHRRARHGLPDARQGLLGQRPRRRVSRRGLRACGPELGEGLRRECAAVHLAIRGEGERVDDQNLLWKERMRQILAKLPLDDFGA